MRRRELLKGLGQGAALLALVPGSPPAKTDEPKLQHVKCGPDGVPCLPAPGTDYTVEWIDGPPPTHEPEETQFFADLSRAMDGPGFVNPDAVYVFGEYRFRIKPTKLVTVAEYEAMGGTA